VYEWPLRRKEKWSVKKLLAKGQQRLLIGWLRHVERLRGEQEMVHIYEPEAGRNLSNDEEERSLEDLLNCQEGSEEILGCNKKRSRDDLKDCHECRIENSGFQEGNEMRSLEDLIDY
jgi:hypothetical protein